MVGLDVHDVVVFRYRPVRPEHAVLAIMHRRFLAQPVEIRPEGIGTKQFGIARIELLERSGIGQASSGLLPGLYSRIDGAVHSACSLVAPPRLFVRGLI